MPYFGVNELPQPLRLYLIDKIDGGFFDVVLVYDSACQALRWWRLGGSDQAPQTGSVPIPPHLLPFAEALPRPAPSDTSPFRGSGPGRSGSVTTPLPGMEPPDPGA
jgi:hypothetical protein